MVIFITHQYKQYIIFLSSSLNICFWCSKEPSLWDGSFEYLQHMFWLRNKKKIMFIYALLSGMIRCSNESSQLTTCSLIWLFCYFSTGKDYQELRVKKRERRQPGVIQDLAYLHWERTGQPPAGPYSVSLSILVVSCLRFIVKPVFSNHSNWPAPCRTLLSKFFNFLWFVWVSLCQSTMFQSCWAWGGIRVGEREGNPGWFRTWPIFTGRELVNPLQDLTQ